MKLVKFFKNIFIFVFLIVITTLFGMSMTYGAEKKGGRKVQEVSFDGSDVDGEHRKPDGSYLVQKRGLDFIPLYNVRNRFDQSIKESVDHMR